MDYVKVARQAITRQVSPAGALGASAFTEPGARQKRPMRQKVEARPLAPAEALELTAAVFADVATWYEGGALGLLDTDPDLRRGFHETEEAINAAAKAGCTEPELRAALAAHVAVIRECCERMRARQERAADPMPDLPGDAVAAVGFSYGDGTPGVWVAEVKR